MNEHKFSLSKRVEEALPTHIAVEGKRYPIHSDFRKILRIYRLFDDPDIAERHKPIQACRAFYAKEMPPDGYRHLLAFLVLNTATRDPNAPPMDFEFDADVIYASFRQQYGINLARVKYLHWYEFLMLLQGLGEDTALAARLFARGRDTGKIKGKDRAKEKQSAEIAKRNAQIPKRVGSREQAMQRAVMDALMNGGNVSGLLQMMEEGR